MADSPFRLDRLVTHVEGMAPPGAPLDRLAAAAGLAGRLDETADHLLGHFVDEARAAGLSWTDIGQRIGITKQAARKRFAPRDVGEVSGRGDKAFRRYGAEARAAVVLAQDDARRRRHAAIGAEHLLIGLCSHDGTLATRALVAAGASPRALADSVSARLQPGTARVRGHLPLTLDARKALELAARNGLLLGDATIEPEHLLLGLTALGSGPVAEVLEQAGVTAERLRAEVVRLRAV